MYTRHLIDLPLEGQVKLHHCLRSLPPAVLAPLSSIPTQSETFSSNSHRTLRQLTRWPLQTPIEFAQVPLSVSVLLCMHISPSRSCSCLLIMESTCQENQINFLCITSSPVDATPSASSFVLTRSKASFALACFVS